MGKLTKMKYGWVISVGFYGFLLTWFLAVIAFKVFAVPRTTLESFLPLLAGCLFGLVVLGVLLVIFFPREEDKDTFRAYHKMFAIGFSVCFIGACLGFIFRDEHVMKVIFNIGAAIAACGIFQSWRE